MAAGWAAPLALMRGLWSGSDLVLQHYVNMAL